MAAPRKSKPKGSRASALERCRKKCNDYALVLEEVAKLLQVQWPEGLPLILKMLETRLEWTVGDTPGTDVVGRLQELEARLKEGERQRDLLYSRVVHLQAASGIIYNPALAPELPEELPTT